MTITLDRPDTETPVLAPQYEEQAGIVLEGDFEATLDHAHAAHIVHVPEDADTTPHALVTWARVMGMPVTALCGWSWVPQRDPKALPICQECYDIQQDMVVPEERGMLPDA